MHEAPATCGLVRQNSQTAVCSLGNGPKRTNNASCLARALPALRRFPCCSPSGMDTQRQRHARRTAGNAVLPRHGPLGSRKRARPFLSHFRRFFPSHKQFIGILPRHTYSAEQPMQGEVNRQTGIPARLASSAVQ